MEKGKRFLERIILPAVRLMKLEVITKLRFTIPVVGLALLLIGGCSEEDIDISDPQWYVSIVKNNTIADGFDFPVDPGEMDGWIEPPSPDSVWDAASYLVHREDGIHPAIDFMREDGSSAGDYELWAIGDGVVVDIVYDREVYPDLHDGGDRDQGWGNLILIQHDYMENDEKKRVWSMYAHCATVEVELNQVVKRKQRIGMVGQTDGVAGTEMWNDHLHFELRTINFIADMWPQSAQLNTDTEVEKFYTHPLEFIRGHRGE